MFIAWDNVDAKMILEEVYRVDGSPLVNEDYILAMVVSLCPREVKEAGVWVP
jgi:hypothetical protein